MENYKQQIIDRGYQLVAETEEGYCFVNESTNFCAILLKEYCSEHYNNAKSGYELLEILKNKYGFAEKATICVIVNVTSDENKSKESIERDEYFFLKIFPERIHILPIKSNKEVKITFEPMSGENDKGNYTINPFDKFDGLCSSNFLEYLSKAQDGDIIKYPKIVDTSFFRYWGQKLYQIEIVK